MYIDSIAIIFVYRFAYPDWPRMGHPRNTYIYTYARMYVFMLIHTYIYIYTQTHVYIHIYIYMYTHIHRYIHTYIHMYILSTAAATANHFTQATQNIAKSTHGKTEDKQMQLPTMQNRQD